MAIRKSAFAGALFASAALMAMPAFALEGDVDVDAPGADVRVDGDRPAVRAETPDADADARIYAEDSEKGQVYAPESEAGDDADADVDLGEPGASVDID